jgi:hypothetical protein
VRVALASDCVAESGRSCTNRTGLDFESPVPIGLDAAIILSQDRTERAAAIVNQSNSTATKDIFALLRFFTVPVIRDPFHCDFVLV